MRPKMIVGNWKMNKTISETKAFVKNLRFLEKAAVPREIILGIAPSYLSLETVVNKAKFTRVYAQNVHDLDHGAFTGEVSIPMLKELKINGSLVGHSERRIYDNETSEKCHLKIQALLDHKLEAIYCVGENLADYEAGKSKEVVKQQIVAGLKGLSGPLDLLTIAYEPVWSIGTGVNASKEIAEEMCAFIRNEIKLLTTPSVAENMLILYGGSVKPENIHDYFLGENIDGALVGGASLKLESFEELITNSY